MAKLSNINGKFAVEDTGAIRFSDQTGTTGQILKSNGNSAPTWVDPNTVGTGPWLPLAGGIVSGATTFQSSLTVGGTLTVNGSGGSVFNSTATTNHIIAAYRASNGNNVATFRTTDSGYIFRIHAQNAGTIYVQNDDGSNYIKIPDSGSNEVSGNTTFAGNVTLSQPTNGAEAKLTLTSKSAAGNSRTGIIEYDADVEKIFFINEGSTVAAITSDAKVGIGTDSPDAKLEVESDVNSAFYSIFAKNLNSGSSAFVSKKWLNDDSAFGEIWRNSSARSGTGQSALSFNMYNSHDINFWSGASHTMALVGSNVGIGTDSPQERLHVVGLDGSVPLSSYYGSLVVDNNGEAAMSIIGNSYSSIYFGDAATNFAGGVIYEHSSNSMNFRTNGNSEKMRITSGGIVNIGGTTGNGSRFNIIGDTTTSVGYNQMNIANANGGWGLLLGFGNGVATGNYHGLNHAAIINVQSAPLHLGTSNGAKLTILANGNVGIGTTSPDFALDIEAISSGVQLQMGRISTNVGSAWMGASGSGFALGVGAYGAGNSTTDPNGFLIDASGNLSTKRRIQAKTDTGVGVAVTRNLFVAHGGSGFDYTFDPVALFGAALGGGKLLLEVTGWPSRLNCGYIVWRNDGNGSGLIGTGVVSYVQTAVQSAGNVAVSLPSTSTNEIKITFTGWHTNDHGWSCYIKNDF